MDFLFRTTKADLINTLDTLEEDINLQKQHKGCFNGYIIRLI